MATRWLMLLGCVCAGLMIVGGCGSDVESPPRTDGQGGATNGPVTDATTTTATPPRPADQNWATPPDRITIQLADERFELELAMDDDTRRRGLMHREHMDDDAGMLFAFPDERRRQFWMKNCLIDLDILFLDANGRIVATDTMMAPTELDFGVPVDRSDSVRPAQFAIELNRGTIHRLGLEVGDTIDLPLAALKAHAQ